MKTTPLSATRMGAEVLVQLAGQRADGVVLWRSIKLYFKSGRPEAVTRGDETPSFDKPRVVAAIRELALGTSDDVRLDPQAVAASGLMIDTMGEVWMALTTQLDAAKVAQFVEARGALLVQATGTFARLAQAASSLAKLAAPTNATRVRDLVANKPLPEQRAWIAVFVMGGLTVESEVSAVTKEIRATHAQLANKTHYELLGVGNKATTDEIRKSYLGLAKRWHSDSFAGQELGDTAPLLETIFARLSEAQRVLLDKKEREAYDILLDRKAQGLPTDAQAVLHAESVFKRAQGLVRRGQAPAAVPLLEEAVANNQAEAEFWAYLGFAVYCARGKEVLEEARKHLSKAESLRANLDVVHEFRGRIAHIERDYETAARELKKALEVNPKNHDAERELRLIQMRGGKAPEPRSLGELFQKIIKRPK